MRSFNSSNHSENAIPTSNKSLKTPIPRSPLTIELKDKNLTIANSNLSIKDKRKSTLASMKIVSGDSKQVII